MIKKLVSFLLLIVTAFVVVVLMQPKEISIKESIVINASPKEIFKEVNNFHNWHAWSPWANLDPNSTEEHTGSLEGEGAVFSWAGNQEVGVGSMTITNSQPYERLEIKLDFTAPYEASNLITFELTPEDDSTKVLWTFEGEHNFMGKAMCLIFNCRKMISDQYAKGLNNLKTVVENIHNTKIIEDPKLQDSANEKEPEEAAPIESASDVTEENE
jgi:hypothetical protein